MNNIGFQDGFMGKPARAVSIDHDSQIEYLEAYREGKKHRIQVNEVCKKECLLISEVMKKAFDFYYKEKYNK